MDKNKKEQLNKKIDLLSSSIDKRFNQADERHVKIEGQIELISQTVLGHDEIFIKIDKRFNKIDERFEEVFKLLLNHEDRLARIEINMATKDDIRQINETLETLVKSNNDIKEDHFFGMRWMKRMQDQLGWHESDLKRLKLVLNLV